MQDPVRQDTSAANNLLTDTLRKTSAKGSSSLASPVTYSAEDSIRIDHKNSIVYLFGKARIRYEDFELDADYIRLDQEKNLVFAKGTYDKRGRYQQRPIFKQGSEPPATTDSLVFNFRSKKGKTFGGSYEVEGGFIQAETIKKNEFNEGFIKDAIYSTCNLRHPHYGIHISKGIVTDNQIITKFAYLQVDSVPLPIGVPFGFFPKRNRRASGLMFPTFGEDFSRGFYMRDLGYYLGLNDYWDLAGFGSIYSKGSYELRTQSRYQKRYKYDGSILLSYAASKIGIEGTPSYQTPKDFRITWNHSMRQEANPGTTFSASVNAGTSSYFTNSGAGGTYNIDQLVQNTLSSNISYGKTFGLFNFTSSLSHRQNTSTGDIFLELPQFSLNMSSVSPFDSKNRVGNPKWYQKITVAYSARGSNSIDTKDTLLFRNTSLKDFDNGIQHNVPISFSTNILKFFQFSAGANYAERWYLQSVRKSFSDSLNRVVTDTTAGFSRAGEYSLNTSMSTKLYGQANFRKGKLLALRHVATPSVSFSYRPDFGAPRFGNYRYVYTNAARTDSVRYSIYENSQFGSPGLGRQAAIGFNLDNNLEAKVRSNADSLTNTAKVPILQSLSFSGFYNFAADSLKLSSINFYGRTALFKEKLGINFNGSFNPYQFVANEFGGGTTINRFTIRDGKLARLTDFGLSFDFSLNSEAVARRNRNIEDTRQSMGSMNPQQAEELARISRDPNSFVDFNVPWNISVQYNFRYSKPFNQSTITNTLNVSGDFNVTNNWKVQYTSGYDFQQKEISITQFSIYRDLHCWDLSFSWMPFGPWKSYSMDLKVKASILQDLKLSRRRSHPTVY